MLYSELHCSEAIHKAVEQMGFAEMTEIQEKTIPVMLAGRDVIAKAPTGTGKTCAFGIPVAEQIDPAQKVPQAVILAPTRELAQQIADELTALTAFMPGVAVACVYGGANMEKQARRLAEGCQIVVATPRPPDGPLQTPQHRPLPRHPDRAGRSRRDAEHGLL